MELVLQVALVDFLFVLIEIRDILRSILSLDLHYIVVVIFKFVMTPHFNNSMFVLSAFVTRFW